MASTTQHRLCVHTNPAGVPLLQKQKRRQTTGLKKIDQYYPKMFFMQAEVIRCAEKLAADASKAKS